MNPNHNVMTLLMRLWIALDLCLSLVACDDSTSPVKSSYPDETNPSFVMFVNKCSACHRPPLPDSHTAQEWESVLVRMQLHQVQHGLARMSADEKNQILGYLKAHAKQGER